MTGSYYQTQALRTESDWEAAIPKIDTNPREFARLTEGLMGLNGEAGEAIDILKKCMFQGHNLMEEKEHLAKELGDVAWYLALCADAIGYTLDDIFFLNLQKLQKRYPDGFDPDRSIKREANDI